MNIAIVYYSYSGNTHKAAQLIEDILKNGNTVNRIRIEAQGESRSFFRQALRGLTKKKVDILPVETNLAACDLVILGTPVWDREMCPAMRAYLEKASGLAGKKAVPFVTYGSGFGKEHCLVSLKQAIEQKGANCIGSFSLSQFKAADKSLLEGLLKEFL
ncbi:MAG: NAD(P)H-dependent oxidoreductase [Candidatus Omnitrophota bacterium]